MLRGNVFAFVMATALIPALGSEPAAARSRYYYFSPYDYPPHGFVHKARRKETEKGERVSKEPFGDMPKGPLQIFVSIDQQKLHFYSDGVHVEDEPAATGVAEHPTPMGVFSVIQRDRFHHSNIYSNAPMPFMERITWSGVALHEGVGLGHRASHGCIRMPHDFAARLWTLKTLGMRVIVARSELKPVAFADSHLFVHKDTPAIPAAAAPAETVKTAQSVDGARTIDAASPAPIAAENEKAAADPSAPPADPAAVPAKADDLGLRVNKDGAGGDSAVGDAAKPSAPATAANEPPAATAGSDEAVPIPLVKPAELAASAPARKTPIAIFVSRRTQKLYVRQNFEPLFDVAITIEHPEQPLGTHVFTALDYLDDHSTFRWNVVSLPADPPPAKKVRKSEEEYSYDRYGRRRRHDNGGDTPAAVLPPPQSPADALARIVIPQDVIDHVSEMMVPGSSLVVSDQGLGEETGEGTDFIVVSR